MNPLNNMYDALVSINHILKQRKQTNEVPCIESVENKKTNHERESPFLLDTNATKPSISQLESNAAAKEHNCDQLRFESLTEDNFHRARLCNRSIDELPNISVHDIKRLKLINVHTMQDLLGRFLIHDTAAEFHTFLTKTFHLSEKTASIITHLFDHWTKTNLDAITDDQQVESNKSIR